MTYNSSTQVEQASPLSALIKNTLDRSGPGLYGITGSAGAGKTVAAMHLQGCTAYSTDYRFIGSSLERKVLLHNKQMRSVADYRDSINQFNWWDWGAILSDVEDLLAGKSIQVSAAYSRVTGTVGEEINLRATDRIILEGAILGPPFIVNKCKKIFFLWVDPAVRFQRLLEKDSGRRSFNEICARFLITEYSETLYYQNLFKWAQEKIIFIDGLTGLPRGGGGDNLPSDLFIPLRVNDLSVIE